jgi:hypothetical protein
MSGHFGSPSSGIPDFSDQFMPSLGRAEESHTSDRRQNVGQP